MTWLSWGEYQSRHHAPKKQKAKSQALKTFLNISFLEKGVSSYCYGKKMTFEVCDMMNKLSSNGGLGAC